MEKKSKIIILILAVLFIWGVVAHLFLTPSTVETVGSKNITDMVGRTVQIPASVGNVVATSPPMTTVIYMIAPEKLTAVNFHGLITNLNIFHLNMPAFLLLEVGMEHKMVAMKNL